MSCFLCAFFQPKKLGFVNFGNLRKKKQDDGEEYVCPMDLGQASASGSSKVFRPGLDIRPYEEDDLDRLEQVTVVVVQVGAAMLGCVRGGVCACAHTLYFSELPLFFIPFWSCNMNYYKI